MRPSERTFVAALPITVTRIDLPTTAELPEKERAAVFLRYGYDLSYEDIGTALGSSAEAARQAASSGVRRIRKKELP